MQHPGKGRQQTKRHYLFAVWDGAGALIVELRLAAQLVARGYTVTVLGPPSSERKVRAAGCAYLRDGVTTPYDPARDHHDDELLWLREHVWFGAPGALAQQVVEVAGALAVDAIVSDELLFGALVGAAASGLPGAVLGTTLFGLYSPLWHLPPDDPHRAFWEWGLERVNAARSLCGLGPLTSIVEQWDALQRYLVLSVPELDDTAALPTNVRYVGPPRAEAGAERLAASPGGRPIVLISFSTSQQGQRPALQCAVDALAHLDVAGVVTMGEAMAAVALRLPAQVTAVPFLPHDDILPRTAVVVTHAGHGTVMAALAHGVPLVCMPMGRDQHYIAARVTAVGAGVTIAADASAADIAAAVGRVLHDPRFRDNAQRLRASIAALAQQSGGVAELERLGQAPS